MEKRKFSWKEALLLGLVLAVAAGVYLYAKTRPKGAEAVIEQDGEVYRRVVLADLKEPLTLEVNGEQTVYEPKDIAAVRLAVEI